MNKNISNLEQRTSLERLRCRSLAIGVDGAPPVLLLSLCIADSLLPNQKLENRMHMQCAKNCHLTIHQVFKLQLLETAVNFEVVFSYQSNIRCSMQSKSTTLFVLSKH